MLRFEYMPSDFHPMFLFIGEALDLAALAKLLRRFAEAPQPIAVAERIPGATSRNELTLTPADDAFGMRDLGGVAYGFGAGGPVGGGRALRSGGARLFRGARLGAAERPGVKSFAQWNAWVRCPLCHVSGRQAGGAGSR